MRETMEEDRKQWRKIMAKAKMIEKLDGRNDIVWVTGQKVVVDRCQSESIRTISRITKGWGGTVYVKEGESETAFDRFGHQRGGGTWSQALIKPATESDIIRVKGKIARNQLARFNWSELDPLKAIGIRDKLRSVYGLDI